MASRVPRRQRSLARVFVLVLTLVGHLAITLGFPLPAPTRRKPTDGVAYPCQSRPCGCLTSEQCWAGDCCCFTLADKLAWAEANGVAPPEHVRPLVESRRSRPTPPKPKSCCAESDPATEPSATAAPTCCRERPACESAPAADCPLCVASTTPECREKKAPTADQTGVRWVVGLFAQKCRGEGPAGLFQLDPAVVPDLAPVFLAGPDCGDHAAPRSERAASLTHAPPTRPPRSS
jgi:hypothetical protein